MVLSDENADFDLVRKMADQQDAAGAKEAWAQLYVRHNRSALRIALCQHAYLLDREGVEEVVQDAFVKAYRSAGTFDVQEQCTPEVQSRKVRAWLLRIVENIVCDRFRGQPVIEVLEDEELANTASTAPDETVNAPDSERLIATKEAWSTLSDIEQTVLRATLNWWRPGETHQRMPNEAVQQLVRLTGKSSDNLRQIRSRAMKKVEHYLRAAYRDEKA